MTRVTAGTTTTTIEPVTSGMQVKRFPIKQQDFDKVVHMDQSAAHWSNEHTRHSAAAMDALSTWRDLVTAKTQSVTELVKSAGVKDMNRVVQARLVKDEKGESFIEVALHDEPEAAPAPEAPPAPAPEAPPAPAS